MAGSEPSFQYEFFGDWEHLYFHDSRVKEVQVSEDRLMFLLEFAHVLAEHPENATGKILCGLKAQLIFHGLIDWEMTVYQDSTGETFPVDTIQLPEILRTGLTEEGKMYLEGFAAPTEGWGRLTVDAQVVSLGFDTLSDSWLNS